MTNLPGVQNEGGVLDGLWEFEGEVCVVLDGKFINMSGGTIGDMVVCNRIDRTFTLKNFHDGLVYTACWNLDATEIEWLTPTSGVWTRQQDMAGAEEREDQVRVPVSEVGSVSNACLFLRYISGPVTPAQRNRPLSRRLVARGAYLRSLRRA